LRCPWACRAGRGRGGTPVFAIGPTTQRHLHDEKIRFAPTDRAFLAALLHKLPRDALHRIRLLVRPETVLRWYRDLITRRHAAISRPRSAGRHPTVRSIRVLVLCLAGENNNWVYRRIHGELLVLGIKVVASTVWEILKDAGIDPAPRRTSQTWAAFLRSQAQAIIAADFFEASTLSGAQLYVLAIIEHATRRVHILGATAHPTAAWVAQAARNLAMDIQDAGCRVKYLIRDHDGKYPGPVRRHPRRHRHHDRAQRRPGSTHELNHVAVDPNPAATNYSTAHSSGTRRTCSTPYGSMRGTTTRTGHIGASRMPDRCARSPSRSPTKPQSHTCTSADGTASAASSMNTNMPPELHG
jgi:transposase